MSFPNLPAPAVLLPLRRRLPLVVLGVLSVGSLEAQPSRPAAAASMVKPTVTALQNSPLAATPGYYRLGAPIQFSARLLPADATGTVSFVVDGVPAQTVALSTQTLGDYVAMGDSITFDGYIGDPGQRYARLLGQRFNLLTDIDAAGGYTGCDAMPLEAISLNVGGIAAKNPLYSLMVGASDISFFGAGSHEAQFNLCDQALLSWLGVPRQNKAIVGDAGVAVTSGTWATNNLSNGGCCFQSLSTTGGSGSVRFNLASRGGPLYLWYGIQTTASGSFTVSLDGGAPGPPVSTLCGPIGNTSSSYGVVRLPVAAGDHTIEVAAVSGTVTLLGVGAAPAVGSARPTVLISDVPHEMNGLNAAAIDAYTADVQANLNQMLADGMDVRFVRTQNYMAATAAEMMDSKHPNAAGLAEIAQAFEDAITQVPANDTISVAVANFSPGSFSLGGHEVDMNYSGDANYAPAAGYAFFGVYDGTSSTALSVDGSSVLVGNPITLTAAIAQPNADGQVKFVEVTAAGNAQLGTGWMNQTIAGSALLTLPALPLGQHTLQAQYLGNWRYNGSTSAPITLAVVGHPSSTSVSSVAASYFLGAPAVLSATVSPSSASGTVTFFDGASSLGQATLAGGVATFSTSALATGTHAITARYAGDSLDQPSDTSAAPLSVGVTPPLSAAISPTQINASPGSTNILSLVLTPLSGFTGGVQSTCQSPVSFVTCSVPALSAIGGAAPLNVPVTVRVASSSLSSSGRSPAVPGGRAALATALAVSLLPWLSRRSPRPLRLLAGLLLVGLATWPVAGCAGGDSFGSIPPGARALHLTISAGNWATSSSVTVNIAN